MRLDSPATPAAARVRGLPENSFSRLTRLKRELAKRCPDLIDLSEGIPDHPPHPRLLQFLASNAAKPDVHSYTGGAGATSLRRALFSYLATEFSVDSSDLGLLPGAGSKELIAHLCQAVLDEGDIALIPEVHYPLYPAAVRYSGGVPVTYPLRPEAGWAPDLAAVPDEVLDRTKLAILNYPHNPTGGVVDQSTLDDLVEWLRNRSIVVCLDLAYSHIYYGGAVAPGALRNAGDTNGILELHTFSKNLGLPGWRMAFAAGDPRLVDLVDASRSVFSTGLFVLLQKSLRYGLINFAEFSAGIRERYRARVEHAVSALRAAGVDAAEPGGTFFLWLRLPLPGSATEQVTRLVEDQRVLLMPGAAFGERADEHVRLCLTAPEPVLAEAIRRILEHLRRSCGAGSGRDTESETNPCRT